MTFGKRIIERLKRFPVNVWRIVTVMLLGRTTEQGTTGPWIRMFCDECGWRGSADDRLVGENPFMVGDTVCGCPACKEIDPFRVACDEPGCWAPTECGTPTLGGYRRTCREHKPKEKNDE